MDAKIRDRLKNGEGSVFQRSTYFMFGFQIIYTFQSERKETSYVNVKLDQSVLIINIQLHYSLRRYKNASEECRKTIALISKNRRSID